MTNKTITITLDDLVAFTFDIKADTKGYIVGTAREKYKLEDLTSLIRMAKSVAKILPDMVSSNRYEIRYVEATKVVNKDEEYYTLTFRAREI